jgi:hypothetical protein
VTPTPGAGKPADAERRIRIVESGWQVILVVTAAAALPAKSLIERGDV